jgi:CHRD domain
MQKTFTLLVFALLSFASAQTIPAVSSMSYSISPTGSSDVSGTVYLGDYGLGNTVVAIALKGTTGGQHPAHFHSGNCGSNGDVVVPLENVAGATGLSVTVTSVPLDTILSGNHYINIHASPQDLATIVACGEVGGAATLATITTTPSNAAAQTATGVKPEEFETRIRTAGYGIFAVNNSGIGGQMQVSEQVEGGTNIIVTLDSIEVGKYYAMELRQGDCGPDRALLSPLEPVPSVAGDPRASWTELPLTFEEIAEANNFIYVYAPDNSGTVVACGEVGLGANQ